MGGDTTQREPSVSLEAVKRPVNSSILLFSFRGLTDGGKDACEAEVVHSVEREQVEQKLLPFFLTEQECMRFIQLPVRGQEGRESSDIYKRKTCVYLSLQSIKSEL